MHKLTVKDVIAIHNLVTEPDEPFEFSPAGQLALRLELQEIDNLRSNDDVFYYIAKCAEILATSHIFHSANKRTTLQMIDTMLIQNNVGKYYDAEELASKIIDLAKGIIVASDLACWLRHLQLMQLFPPEQSNL